MREDFYVKSENGTTIVSADCINEISEYLIAKVDNQDDLNNIIYNQVLEKAARQEALKRAYKEIPIPSYRVPVETLRELSEERNELTEKFYIQIISGL